MFIFYSSGLCKKQTDEAVFGITASKIKIFNYKKNFVC
jgi:hypothetical protein